jgi:hypothetical protein
LDELKSVLPTCEGLAATTDMWTSQAGDAFMSYTIHFISETKTPSLELHKIMLKCLPFEGSHTSHSIARALDKVVVEIPGLKEETMRVVVHDSAANIKAAIPKSNELTDSLLCADHLINLVRSLLDMSVCKAGAGRILPTPEPFLVDGVVVNELLFF